MKSPFGTMEDRFRIIKARVIIVLNRERVMGDPTFTTTKSSQRVGHEATSHKINNDPGAITGHDKIQFRNNLAFIFHGNTREITHQVLITRRVMIGDLIHQIGRSIQHFKQIKQTCRAYVKQHTKQDMFIALDTPPVTQSEAISLCRTYE